MKQRLSIKDSKCVKTVFYIDTSLVYGSMPDKFVTGHFFIIVYCLTITYLENFKSPVVPIYTIHIPEACLTLFPKTILFSLGGIVEILAEEIVVIWLV